MAAISANTRYSPLTQIDASNFSKLQLAWTFSTANFGPTPETNLESTPLVIDGVLYSTAGDRRDVVALDAATGEVLWTHREDEGKRAEVSPRRLSGRGLAYWADGDDKRIVYFTQGYRMIELDAKTGHRIPSFGVDGAVDLKQDDDQEIDPLSSEIGIHATPGDRQGHHRGGRRSQAGRRAHQQDQCQRLCPRIRCPHGQA